MKGAARRLLLRARAAADASPVPSPCICVCTMDPATGWCQGCFRTLDEIAAWSAMDEGARRGVWSGAEARARTLLAASEQQEPT